jgi:hypothetical protein
MKKYTIESLKEINENYDQYHKVCQNDVDKANQLVEVIENSRNNKTPQIGDIVDFTAENGNYYKNAHIQSISEEGLYICEVPHTPFVGINELENNISTSTGGGAWDTIPSDLKYVGKREKNFRVFGWCGACKDGHIDFFAEVSVWEYTEGNPEFTTKNYDRFAVSIVKPNTLQPYKYIIGKGGIEYTSFRNDEEYQAWINTFNGIEREGKSGNKVVWTYKQEEYCIPIEEYLSIQGAVISSEFCNNTIQECKRVYGENKITTYLPHQKDRIALKNVKMPYVTIK